MATKITYVSRGGSRESGCETDEPVAAFAERVNRALKGDDKFISVEQGNGKAISLVAADIIAISEQ